MNRTKKIHISLFQNATWLFGGNSAAGIFAAIETVVIARLLGVSDYGLLALVIAYVELLNTFFDFGVWETATKYIELSGQTENMLKLNLSLSFPMLWIYLVEF